MQIKRAEITPVELTVERPIQMARIAPIETVTVIFIRLETTSGKNAWGCAVAHPDLTAETPEQVIQACQECASAAPTLHPTNVEYSLSKMEGIAKGSAAALSGFDLAFHDLLGLAAGMPLYRILGGFRNRIQTSATVPIGTVTESVTWAQKRANQGFRMLKVKGGMDPQEDVERVKAIAYALPDHQIRLDADGGYTTWQALEVARALKNRIEMLEQPTLPSDLDSLEQVTANSPVMVLADQSSCGPTAALSLATRRAVGGMSIKMATCGGFRGARQLDAIARAAEIATMVNCVIEPALLIAAGLHYALSSPNVRYADLDGNLDLTNDPTIPGYQLEKGWLVATETPGLGCSVQF